jgi:MbtH protein
MADLDNEDTRLYTVLVNEEEQYSLWLKAREIPRGWRAAGKEGSKAECVKFVDEVWTDMRPLSLRKLDNEAATIEGESSSRH